MKQALFPDVTHLVLIRKDGRWMAIATGPDYPGCPHCGEHPVSVVWPTTFPGTTPGPEVYAATVHYRAAHGSTFRIGFAEDELTQGETQSLGLVAGGDTVPDYLPDGTQWEPLGASGAATVTHEARSKLN